MKKLFFAFLCLGFFASQTLQAQLQKEPEKLTKTLLWKLEGKGLKKPSYIFGTIHMIAEKDYFLPKATEKALKKCKNFVAEVDMSNEMVMAMQLLKLAPMKDKTKLADLLAKEEYETIKNYLTKESPNAEAKMMFPMMENWQPMLTQSIIMQEFIPKPVKSYETELGAIAKKEKMNFAGLETLEDQVAAIDKIPYKDQAKALYELVLEAKKKSPDNEFEKLVKIYKNQDIDGMIEMSKENFDEMGKGSEDALLTVRNNNWIPKIGEMASKTPCFFAVGAAHLGGENGIIRLLKKAGYKLTPVENLP
jgi:uncharacterized protein YbaP (TraB family)